VWLASAVALAACLLAGFRMDFGGDVPSLLRANGARVLLAAGAGVALALSGALRLASGRVRPLGELELLGLSAGAAGGGFFAAEQLSGLPAGPVFAIGAALGAGLLLTAARTLDRPRRWTNLGVAALLGGCIAVAALAGSYARAREDAIAPAVGWLLGDFAWAGLPGAAVVAGLAGVLVLLARRALTGGDANRADALGLIGLGLGIGAAGPLAFVGTFAPRAVRALAPSASPAAVATTGAMAGAAGVAAIDAVPRLLVGGYTLPFNVAAGMLAVPIFLLWNRARLRREAGVLHPLLEAAELLGIGVLTLVAAGLVYFLTAVVRSAT